jgi:hypothetical protein
MPYISFSVQGIRSCIQNLYIYSSYENIAYFVLVIEVVAKDVKDSLQIKLINAEFSVSI